MDTKLDFLAEAWTALRPHIDSTERADATHTLVHFLIDQNCDPIDIKQAFIGSTDVLRSLAEYVEDHTLVEDVEDYDEYESDDVEDDDGLW